MSISSLSSYDLVLAGGTVIDPASEIGRAHV